MRNSYKLRVRAVHQDLSGGAQILLSGADSSTSSCWAALLIVDTHASGVARIVPIPGEGYVINLIPDSGREPAR